MSKARTLANLISDNAELADGQISVAEVVGAAPTANPTFTGNLGVAGNITNASGDLTLDASGDIIFDADGAQLRFYDNGADIAAISNESNNFVIKSQVSNADIVLKGNDGGLTITALTLDVSEAGAATFNSSVTATDVNITSNTPVIRFTESDQSDKQYQLGSFGSAYAIYDSNNSQFRYVLDQNGNHIFNEGGVDADFRVESNNNTHMLFVDGGNNRVMLGGSTQDGVGTLAFNSGSGAIRHVHPAGTAKDNLLFAISGTNNGFQTTIDSSNNITYKFHTGGNTEAVRFGTNESVFNENSVDRDFRVESDGRTHALFVEGSSGNIGLNASTITGWASGINAIDFGGSFGGSVASLAQGSSPYGATYLACNAYLDTISADVTTNWKARSGHFSSAIALNTDAVANIEFFKSAWTAADAAITWQRPLRLIHAESVFNEDSYNVDFRVESDNNTHALFVEAGTNTVGILQPNPNNWSNSANQLVIGTNSGSNGLTVVSGTGNSGNVFFSDGTTGNQQYRGYIQYDHTNDRLNLGAMAADRVRIEGSQTVVNEDSNDHDFRVESDSHSQALFIDAGTGGAEFNTTQSNVGLFIHNTTHDSIVQIQSSGANKNSTIRFADGDDSDAGYIDYDHANDSLRIYSNGNVNGLELSATKGRHYWEVFESWGTNNYNMPIVSGTVFQRKGNIADDVKIRVFQGTYTYSGGSIEYVIRKDSGYQTIVGSGVIYFNGREGDSGHTIVGSNVSNQIVVNGDTSGGTNADGKFTFNIRGTNGDSHISINNRLGSTVNMALKFNILYQG